MLKLQVVLVALGTQGCVVCNTVVSSGVNGWSWAMDVGYRLQVWACKIHQDFGQSGF